MTVAGQLNSLINILRPMDVQDQDTGETITTFDPYHRKVPAQKEDTSGGTTRRGLQVEANVVSVFTVPWIDESRGEIGRQWRVNLANRNEDGLTYEIVSIREPIDRKQWLELHCSAVV